MIRFLPFLFKPVATPHTQLIVGLGNPGRQYCDTLHNIGFKVLDALPFPLVWKSKFKGELAQHAHQKDPIFFLKPQTYMNLSGESVARCAHFYKIPPSQIVVVHDEVDFPFGRLQLRPGGGLAGHNGLKSIAGQLGTREFKRLRMGVGRPEHGSVSDYVLSRFSPQQNAVLDEFIKLACQALESVLQNGLEEAANHFNKKGLLDES